MAIDTAAKRFSVLDWGDISGGLPLPDGAFSPGDRRHLIGLYYGSDAQISVALTGIGATGARGSLGLSASRALSGVGSTGSVGTLVPLTGVNVAISGVMATGSAGNIVSRFSLGLFGQFATGAIGTLGVPLSATLSYTVKLARYTYVVKLGRE